MSGTDAGPSGKTILVVDDEPMVLGLVRNMLRREGYHVLEASDASEALNVWSEHGAGVQLLLTDVVMPGMNGYELAERLKRDRPDLRVLYMSGYQDRVIADLTGLTVEASILIRKPFTQHSLARKVGELLDQSAHSPTPFEPEA